MLINKEHKFVYVTIARAASTYMRYVLADQYGAVDDEDIIFVPGHPYEIPSEYEDYYKFTVFRNPYHRAKSMYSYCCERPKERKKCHKDGIDLKSFNSFLKTFNTTTKIPALRLQHKSVTKDINIWQIEQLAFYLQNLSDHFSIVTVPIRYRNVSKKIPIYTDADLVLVNEIFMQDFIIGRYSMVARVRNIPCA